MVNGVLKEKKFTVVSLFSGAMGLDIGISKTGKYKLLACVEKEPIFCETINLNIKNGNMKDSPIVYEIDIKDLSPEKVLDEIGLKPGELDLLIGGPPCQSFSTAGKRGTINDPRGTLIWEFLRFVKVIQPKIFLMENVRGLLSSALKHRPIALRPENGGFPLSKDEQPGSVLKLFADDLRSIKNCPYHVDCFEVNAVNYGAPQIRERVLFIGNRYNLEINMPLPTHGGNILSGYKDLRPWKTLRDVIGDINDFQPIDVLDFSPRKKNYLSHIPQGGNWRCLPLKLQKESMGRAFIAKGGRSGWWRRLTWDLPCPTLVTMPNHASTSLCHPEHLRALSLKEYCRIQEFPENWLVAGTVSQKYTQIGNAVPTKLGEIAGEIISKSLINIYKNKSNYIENGSFILPYKIIYLQSHVRTRSWYKNGQAILWEDDNFDNLALYNAPKTLKNVTYVKEKEAVYGK
jgi:DNA (cytosine-5)-methyltransferase 1